MSVSETSNETQPESHEDIPMKNEPMPDGTTVRVNSLEGEPHSSATASSEERLLDSVLLLCCEDSLHLYSTKSVIQVLLCPLFIFTLEYEGSSVCKLKGYFLLGK